MDAVGFRPVVAAQTGWPSRMVGLRRRCNRQPRTEWSSDDRDRALEPPLVRGSVGGMPLINRPQKQDEGDLSQER